MQNDFETKIETLKEKAKKGEKVSSIELERLNKTTKTVRMKE